MGQGYDARLDLQAQAASFRGVSIDSVLASQTIISPSGGLQTVDGYAVYCPGINGYCLFFRPGPVEHGGPVSLTGHVTAWGLGIPGLSLRGTARVLTDLGSSDVWPATRPQFQLLEGYAEYANGVVTARGGRVQSISRLGSIGYDGVTATARVLKYGIDVTGFGGFGLAQASAIPINDPVLNPLDQYQPSERQWVLGGSAGWSAPFVSTRLLYQIEIDRRSQYRISERSGIELVLRPPVRGLTFTGGADYDMATAVWGSAEGNLNMVYGPFTVSLGARRYRPQFDLWTIWGAFSPTPYHAWNASIHVAALRTLKLSGRVERYQYEPTDADTPLVEVQENGWRGSVTADATLDQSVDFSASFRRETGFGAASNSWDASLNYQLIKTISFSVVGAALERPLELRFDNSTVWMVGVRAAAQPSTGVSVSFGAGRYYEKRDRPDAAAFDWNQVRLDARVTLFFGSGIDLSRLPPAIPMPK
jgi:hypothetical protein